MSDVWIFHGSEPVLWRIPCRVILEKDERSKSERRTVFLEPAVVLMGIQRMALNNFFRSQKCFKNVDGKWQFVQPQIRYWTRMEELGATRATSDDPEDHLVWGARRPPLGDLKPEQKERWAWLEEMLARGVGDSVEQLAYHWRAFCLHIAHTLINREQPVDCYYFRLHNCPLRADWMDYAGRPAPYKAVNFMWHVMEGARIMAMDIEGQHCLRHIELEHTDEWWNLVRKAESQRRRAAGPEKYARNFQGSLGRFAPTAWALFWSHRKEMAQAHARRVSHGHGGGFRLVPDPMARNVYGTAYQLTHPPDKPTLKSLQEAIAHTKAALSRAHGRVPAVSDIRPSPQVVRQPEDEGPGPAVDQPGDGARGSDGVLVCDAGRGMVSEEAVLAPRAGNNDGGLAAGT